MYHMSLFLLVAVNQTNTFRLKSVDWFKNDTTTTTTTWMTTVHHFAIKDRRWTGSLMKMTTTVSCSLPLDISSKINPSHPPTTSPYFRDLAFRLLNITCNCAYNVYHLQVSWQVLRFALLSSFLVQMGPVFLTVGTSTLIIKLKCNCSKTILQNIILSMKTKAKFTPS